MNISSSQILLTVTLSIDHYIFMNIYIITHTKEKPSTTSRGWFLFCVSYYPRQVDTFRKISKTMEVKE